MIERHVTFSVLPDRTADFEDLFVSQYRPAMARMPGYVKVGLLREQEDPSKYQMVIRFESMETAAAWRTSDAHVALKPKIGAMYEGSSLEVYDVVSLGRRIGRFVLRLMPYRGWIGVSICIWGLWGTLSSLRIIPILWLAPVGLWWVTNLAGSLLNVGVGLVVGFDFIQARLLSKVSISKEIMEKIEKFFMRLAGRKVYLGYISVAAAAWILIINIVTVLQWRGP